MFTKIAFYLFGHNIKDSIKEILKDIREIHKVLKILIPIKQESEKIKPDINKANVLIEDFEKTTKQHIDREHWLEAINYKLDKIKEKPKYSFEEKMNSLKKQLDNRNDELEKLLKVYPLYLHPDIRNIVMEIRKDNKFILTQL